MNDHPDALELIRIAHQTLAGEVLPDAKPEHRYALRMIAHALGIAARELASQAADDAAEMRGLRSLYDDAQAADNLHAHNRQLAQDIRRGAFEGSREQAAALRQHLQATARAKLAVAYPKALVAVGDN